MLRSSSMTTSKERVSLGLKQVQPNPWESVTEKYTLGTSCFW
jgi:small subunit ribosomal protein S1